MSEEANNNRTPHVLEAQVEVMKAPMKAWGFIKYEPDGVIRLRFFTDAPNREGIRPSMIGMIYFSREEWEAAKRMFAVDEFGTETN